MTTACSLVPRRFADGRHDAIEAGLRAAGLTLTDDPERAETLITWNRFAGRIDDLATACEARGGKVIVCEEAYTRRLVPGKHFAMALGGHNGSGRWFPGGPERWRALGLEIAPWRPAGGYLLVCCARGMGSPEMREPRGWCDRAVKTLRAHGVRDIRIRRHPGKAYHERPLADDLAGASMVVVWASNCATEALLAGIPVIYDAPHIATAGAAYPGVWRYLCGGPAPQPLYGDRQAAFERLAWAQWTMEEIAAGDPFRHLLGGAERCGDRPESAPPIPGEARRLAADSG